MTAEETGRRLAGVLDGLTGECRERAEELTRELMAFYEEGLTALLRALPEGALARVLDDPAAAGLLVLHELHPESTAARIGRALEGTGAEYRAFDAAAGTLTLRRPPGGCGCGGTREVESALACHAPEVTGVVWESAPAPLLQIGHRPVEASR
ncbi:thioredoxin [Streptomyces sp. NPDC057638]|uniref:thioredoxin n=1 Tax=Streptomyces sp. NPDC057638 TaxID=3346190 RepID=UPI0036A0E749